MPYYLSYGSIGDPGIHPAFIGDPGIAPVFVETRLAPQLVLPAPSPKPALYRFLSWGGSGFVAPPPAWWVVNSGGWASSGKNLCVVATVLSTQYPTALFYLESDQGGWVGGGGATAAEWLAFLNCKAALDAGGWNKGIY